MKDIILGGQDTEKLYLKDLTFSDGNDRIIVMKTNIRNIDMKSLIIRHIGRYGLIGLYLRPKMFILDFPCGSGYASQIFKNFPVIYDGRDYDKHTIQYARRLYGNERTLFGIDDLTNPPQYNNLYNVIACIEGLEHIEEKYQLPLIKSFYNALLPGGVLVVSTPEIPLEMSGKSESNKYHLWELSLEDFNILLHQVFSKVEIITHEEVLSTGSLGNCMYGICKK